MLISKLMQQKKNLKSNTLWLENANLNWSDFNIQPAVNKNRSQ